MKKMRVKFKDELHSSGRIGALFYDGDWHMRISGFSDALIILLHIVHRSGCTNKSRPTVRITRLPRETFNVIAAREHESHAIGRSGACGCWAAPRLARNPSSSVLASQYIHGMEGKKYPRFPRRGMKWPVRNHASEVSTAQPFNLITGNRARSR